MNANNFGPACILTFGGLKRPGSICDMRALYGGDEDLTLLRYELNDLWWREGRFDKRHW